MEIKKKLFAWIFLLAAENNQFYSRSRWRNSIIFLLAGFNYGFYEASEPCGRFGAVICCMPRIGKWFGKMREMSEVLAAGGY